MLSYLMILVHTVKEQILNKYSPDINTIITGFKNKISQLCKSLGLLDKCNEVVNIAQFFQVQQKQMRMWKPPTAVCSTYFQFKNIGCQQDN